MTTDIKEELAKELLNVIQATKEGIAKGADIAFKEVPEIVNEILWFAGLENAVSVIFGIAILTTVIILGTKITKQFCKITDDEEYKLFATGMAIVIGSVITGLILVEGIRPSLMNLIKVIVAPRLYIIEYLSAFLK